MAKDFTGQDAQNFVNADNAVNIKTNRRHEKEIGLLQRLVMKKTRNDPNPSPSGQAIKTSVNVKLTASGNTVTAAAAESKVFAFYSPDLGGFIPKTLENSITHNSAGATSGRKYDFFLYWDESVGDAVLDKVIWTNDTTRSVALTTQDGAQLLSTDLSWRYVGWAYYNGASMQVASTDGAGMTWYGTGDPNDPTGSDPFTGMILNATGLYGYSAGVLQASMNNTGAITAGAGAVVLDLLGIRVTGSVFEDDSRAYTFADGNSPPAYYGGIFQYIASAINTIRVKALATTGNDTILHMEALAQPGKEAQLLLEVDDGSGSTTFITMTSTSGSSSLNTNNLDDMTLAVNDAASISAVNLSLDGSTNISLTSSGGNIDLTPHVGGNVTVHRDLVVTGTSMVGGGDAVDIIKSDVFTPTVAGTGTPGTPTYTTQLGAYYVIGKAVFVEISLAWSAIAGTPTGNLVVGGLPYTAANNGIGVSMAVGFSNITLAAIGNKLQPAIQPNTTTILFTEVGSAAQSSVAVDTAGTLRLSGWYLRA